MREWSANIFILSFFKDQHDREALNAELKSIIKSGILDLGVLGLWERDPVEVKLEIKNNIPRQVKEQTLKVKKTHFLCFMFQASIQTKD